ncbi:Regulator of telomere elongation helicase 1-like [Gracilariopsis chorda]|uniref:Regulator of telomere elongation helicase 1-like n=1 Tax=Gracilariopsis chorda TaxID=448386 RepID=A0A2V3IQB1_9FLOR|nr:Regulator of telomere elongation helicase 1-like [Gracilariopsis chorda]|eukprot:PXF44276.1 Regulator of telomere elongation helicase 1-like [Gracilariopsis chorda]
MPSFHVAGVPIQFSFQPYRTQLALMHTVICAARQPKNAVIESPTGPGKSLALLCSALALQQYLIDNDSNNTPEPHLTPTQPLNAQPNSKNPKNPPPFSLNP